MDASRINENEPLNQNFWSISVYVDQAENLIGIPCGRSKQYGVADIDVVLRLKAPYSDERLEQYVEEVFGACYTKDHNDQSDYSTIEKYTKVKGFLNATKDLTLLTLVKTTKQGYSIMPTFHDLERGPVVIDDDEVCLSLQFAKGEMAMAIRRMIAVYVKANLAAGILLAERKNRERTGE